MIHVHAVTHSRGGGGWCSCHIFLFSCHRPLPARCLPACLPAFLFLKSQNQFLRCCFHFCTAGISSLSCSVESSRVFPFCYWRNKMKNCVGFYFKTRRRRRRRRRKRRGRLFARFQTAERAFLCFYFRIR